MGAVTAAVIGAGTALYSANRASKQQKDAQKFAKEQMAAADPFKEYRPGYATQLKALTDDPSSISNTATYKARLQAAERYMAAQGYTGSGNAAVAAADAGASAYQQEFENLAMLSGASTGMQTAAGMYGSAANSIDNANSTKLSGIMGAGQALSNLAGMFGGASSKPTLTTFNVPAQVAVQPTYTSPALNAPPTLNF